MTIPMNMPIAPSAVVKHKIAWRKCKNFDMDATVHVISSHNPWRPGSRAWKLFELVLRVKPVTTIRDIITDAMAAGYADDTDVMSHLRWLYTWGDFLEINGQRYFPKQEPLPGEDKDVA